MTRGSKAVYEYGYEYGEPEQGYGLEPHEDAPVMAGVSDAALAPAHRHTAAPVP